MSELIAHIRRPHAASRFHFARHLVEMFVSMWIGMVVGGGLLAAALGTSVPHARREHALAWLLVMALDMTIPMVAVMLYRGHSWRSTAEMAATMLLPALPFAALLGAHAISGSSSGAYMCLSMVAMIALIVYRRNEYRAAAGGHA
jgi:hypothetical protein